MVNPVALFHHDQVAADHIGADIKLPGQLRNRVMVGTQLRSTFEAAMRVAEMRFGAESGTRGHRPAKSHARRQGAIVTISFTGARIHRLAAQVAAVAVPARPAWPRS